MKRIARRIGLGGGLPSWFTSFGKLQLRPLGLRFSLDGPGSAALRRAQEIDKETVRSGHAFGQLTEEGDAGVDVRAFAVVRVNEAAFELQLAGIVHREERSVLRVELRPEIKAALLHPAFEVVLRDFVGAIEKRIVRLEEFDW